MPPEVSPGNCLPAINAARAVVSARRDQESGACGIRGVRSRGTEEGGRVADGDKILGLIRGKRWLFWGMSYRVVNVSKILWKSMRATLANLAPSILK